MTERPPVVVPAGFSLITVDEVGSTNDEALRRASEGEAAGTVVWARRQSSGRGRRGRFWDSPPGNLYCSVVLRPSRAPAAHLSYVAAVALAETLAERAPASVRLKWPNDVLLGSEKVAGILLEGGHGDDGRPHVVVGTGVNVASHPAEGGAVAPTSLAAHAIDVTVEAILQSYLRRLAEWVQRWETDGFAAVRSAWLERAAGIGAAIEVRLPLEKVPGRFSGLDEDGVLVVDTSQGTRRFAAGDVFLLGEGGGRAARH
ncbi:MAG: biotin--[acetyl-CoA-carboxylase] ligase [Alphaproteobacteria bacterium]|nr:biotin--[acetyl-CoA-carboxylase] ligase [Alphaproteobacteria bacterium]